MITVSEVRRIGIAKRLVDAGLRELVEKGVQLSRIKGIAELPDKIGRPREGRLTMGLGT
jgi:hypothetical protein